MNQQDDKKLDWMYKSASSLVDREDYLLGRSVDKTLDQLNQEEKEKKLGIVPPKNHVEHECIPPSIRDYNKIVQQEQVDLSAKLQEDPLMAIKKREEEARRQFLQNPIQLKKLQEALKAQTMKRKKKKKKSESDSDLDEKIASKLKYLKAGLVAEGFPRKQKKRKETSLDIILMHKYNQLKDQLSQKDMDDILAGKTSSSDSEGSEQSETSKLGKVKDESKLKKNKTQDTSDSDSGKGCKSYKRRQSKVNDRRNDNNHETENEKRSRKVEHRKRRGSSSSSSSSEGTNKRERYKKSQSKNRGREKNDKDESKSKKKKPRDSSDDSDSGKRAKSFKKSETKEYERNYNRENEDNRSSRKKRDSSSDDNRKEHYMKGQSRTKSAIKRQDLRSREIDDKNRGANRSSSSSSSDENTKRRNSRKIISLSGNYRKRRNERNSKEEKKYKTLNKDKRRVEDGSERKVINDKTNRCKKLKPHSNRRSDSSEDSDDRGKKSERKGNNSNVRKSQKTKKESDKSSDSDDGSKKQGISKKDSENYLDEMIMRKLHMLRDSIPEKSSKEKLPPSTPHYDSDEDEHVSKPKSYGLVRPDGTKIFLKQQPIVEKVPKPKEPEPVKKPERKSVKRLTDREKEELRKEMMKDAVKREKERSDNLHKYRRDAEKEEIERTRSEFDKNFVHKELIKSAKDASVESRIKSNLNNIQRASRHMSDNFSKRT